MDGPSPGLLSLFGCHWQAAILSVSGHKPVEKAKQHGQPKPNAFRASQIMEIQQVGNMLDALDMHFLGAA